MRWRWSRELSSESLGCGAWPNSAVSSLGMLRRWLGLTMKEKLNIGLCISLEHFELQGNVLGQYRFSERVQMVLAPSRTVKPELVTDEEI